MPSVLILIILAGISQGFANTLRKHLALTRFRATTVSTTIMLLDSMLCFPFMFLDFRIATDPVVWLLTMASVAAFAFSLAFLIKSYQKLDLSTATIVHRSDIILIAVFGMLALGERLSILQYAGITLLFVSILSIMYDHRRVHITRFALYALVSSLFGATAAVLDKHILNYFSPYTYAFVNSFLVGLVFVARNGTLAESVRLVRTHTLPVLTSSVLGTFTLLTLFTVLSVSRVSLAMPVYKTVIFFVPVFMGITYYKERANLRQKIVGAALALSGIVLMYI